MEPTIKISINNYEYNALCDFGASVSTIPKALYDVLGLKSMSPCQLNLHLADSSTVVAGSELFLAPSRMEQQDIRPVTAITTAKIVVCSIPVQLASSS